MIYKYKDKKPQLEKNIFIAETANLIGDCQIASNASIWFGAVLRADIAAIIIGEGSNVQDGTVCHVDFDKPVIVGKNVTIGHNVTLHACTIKDGALIGMGSVVLDGAVVEEGALVAAGAVVTPNTIVKAGSLYTGNPAKFKRALREEEKLNILENAKIYRELAKDFQ